MGKFYFTVDHHYGVNESTVRTVLKSMEEIKCVFSEVPSCYCVKLYMNQGLLVLNLKHAMFNWLHDYHQKHLHMLTTTMQLWLLYMKTWKQFDLQDKDVLFSKHS